MQAKARACGFTGTRKPLTPVQLANLRSVLAEICKKGVTEFHHGDCIGSDALAHSIALDVGFDRIVIHPPDKPGQRAFCQGFDMMPEKPYLVRGSTLLTLHRTGRR